MIAAHKIEGMAILHGLGGLRQLPAGAVISIGNFDGVHRGHAKLMETGRALRRDGGAHAVVTFEPHPLTVLRPALAPPRLTPAPVKARLLAEAGATHLVNLPPTPDVLGLTADAFFAILRDEVRPTHLVEGPTFNFGKNRGGNIEALRHWTSGTGITLHVIEPVEVALLDLSVVRVSSSTIRFLLASGRARDAAICLGHTFALRGTVIPGHQRGRTFDVRTANLDCGDQAIPLDGVYAARSRIGQKVYPVALSIGTMPTFGVNARQIEAHVLDFSGDLYGQTLEVEVLDYLREQRWYPDVESLTAQIQRDVRDTHARFAFDPTRAIAKVDAGAAAPAASSLTP